MRPVTLLLTAALLASAPAAARGRRNARPTVIRPDQDARARLPAGPRVLVIGAAWPKMSFAERRAGLRVGQAIAQQGAVVVTGGGPGVPYAVARGASSKGGKTVAVAPWASMRQLRRAKDPVRGFSHIWLTRVPQDLQRLGINERSFNHWMHRQTHDVAVADAVVVTPGHGGTLGELGNALVFKRPVAVLQLPGQANGKFTRAMRALRDFYNVDKKNKPPIRFFRSPQRLAAWVVQQSKPSQD